MSEEDTTILQKAQETAKQHKKKAIAGVSLATLSACYAVFVTESHFKDHVQQEREARAAQWRAFQDLHLEVDNVRSNVIWLHALGSTHKNE